ncbi:MAG: hypothetical protein ARM1_0040 [Candidatus Micrarchaeota archaeon]|nr:MAG: hypothetical protein ARM1_0040 [Candidatus Micrarchaeota archaeon]
MNTKLLTLVAVTIYLISFLNISYSYTLFQVKSYLSTFIPGYILNNSTFVNISEYGNRYYIVELNRSSTNIILINVTKNISFVTNTNYIYNVIAPYYVKKYYPSNFTISYLKDAMQIFASQSLANVTECRNMTGLSYGLTCTVANSCESCSLNPFCDAKLKEFGGVNGPFAYGIMVFESQSDNLSANITSYDNLVDSLNQYNIVNNLPLISKTLDKIIKLSIKLPQNYIEPLPYNFNQSLLSNCAQAFYNNTSNYSHAAPYYCIAISYCPAFDINYTTLYNINNTLNQLLKEPLSESNINRIAVNASINALYFISPVIKQRVKIYDTVLNNATSRYRYALSLYQNLSKKIYSDSLVALLKGLNSSYSVIVESGYNQSFANTTFNFNQSFNRLIDQINNYSESYNSLILEYNKTKDAVLFAELTSPNSKQVSSLKSSFDNISALISRPISYSAITNISKNLSLIYTDAFNLINTSTPSALYAITEFNNAIMNNIDISLYYKNILSVLLIPSIVFISLIVLIVIFYLATYRKLKRKKKITLTKKVVRNWHMLFTILVIASIVVAAVLYLYISSLYKEYSFYLFIKGLESSKAIALNVSTLSSNQCIVNLTETLNSIKPLYTYKAGLCYSNKSFSCSSSNFSYLTVEQGKSFNAYYKGLYANQGFIVYNNTSELCNISEALDAIR